MKILKCRRRKFTYQNLPDSGSFYSGVSSRIEKIQLLLYPELELDYLEGFTYYSPLLHNIIAYNRCFYTLAKEGELIAAYPLIRLQADNLKVLVAESLYPNRILSAIFDKGKELTDISIKGKPLKQSEINAATEAKFEGFKAIYCNYSLYVHPSQKHNLKWINKAVKDDETLAFRKAKRTIKRSPAEWDMIQLNQFIADLLFETYQQLLTTLKADKEKLKQYKKWELFSFGIDE